MNNQQFTDSLKNFYRLCRYQNYQGCYLIFENNKNIEFNFDPIFETNSLQGIILNLKGDDYKDDKIILSKNLIRTILKSYNQKYTLHEETQYPTLDRSLRRHTHSLYTWKTDKLNIIFDPDNNTITYKSKKLVAKEIVEQNELEIKLRKEKKAEKIDIENTFKNI